jgi:hypothetical protein
MKKIVVEIILLFFAFSLVSCSKKEIDVTGLYQWSQQDNDLDEEYLKNILVSRKDNGELELVLKDKSRNASGDVIDNYLNTVITIDSPIKSGKVITAYSDSVFAYYKHEFIFTKNSVKWRYCVEEPYLPDITADDIENIEYCKLKKYDPK